MVCNKVWIHRHPSSAPMLEVSELALQRDAFGMCGGVNRPNTCYRGCGTTGNKKTKADIKPISDERTAFKGSSQFATNTIQKV